MSAEDTDTKVPADSSTTLSDSSEPSTSLKPTLPNDTTTNTNKDDDEQQQPSPLISPQMNESIQAGVVTTENPTTEAAPDVEGKEKKVAEETAQEEEGEIGPQPAQADDSTDMMLLDEDPASSDTIGMTEDDIDWLSESSRESKRVKVCAALYMTSWIVFICVGL